MGLAPFDIGMRELALNLNAQLGMAAVRWEVMTGGCPAPAGGLALRVTGLTPHGRAALFWGTQLQSRNVVGNGAGGGGGGGGGGGASGGACRQRTLMVGGAGSGELALEVDAAGEATAAIISVRSRAACAATLFQAVVSGENEAHLADSPGFQAADWPRVADA